VRSLYWLVRLPLKAGSHASALEQSNIASTSKALRLANSNISNRDCDSISINRTALVWSLSNTLGWHVLNWGFNIN